ncbi:hypothetical protein FXV83_16205 [Bradyrhizobium hipponense]|uniref:Chaperone protein DnaJ n=1 Tax=Bradyrhizobium hipponense TaxID=2605638 RepID=A0A5S4YPW6_9BRAD|nr:hypothetical protein [Bradyrhizobium hipponense]TYO65477.1 hypothetical protein FXV83_16205 [Bradyrhizobium hipponense]
MDYHERKALRRQHFEQNVKGWKLVKCSACNGSGYYDNDGSPPCSACNGRGKVATRPQGVR